MRVLIEFYKSLNIFELALHYEKCSEVERKAHLKAF